MQSFDLHAELGRVLEGTDYCPVETLSVSMATTAQVHPRKLTEALIEAAKQRGARVKIGVVEDVQVQTATTETTPQDDASMLTAACCRATA